MARLIKSNGDTIADYSCSSLKAMQDAVGGYIEPVYTSRWVVLVNEEGLLNNLPINIEVSALCGHPIVGDALVMTHNEWNSRN